MRTETHHYQQLIEIFHRCFADSLNTRLVKGDEEPIYLPADELIPYHRIVFAHGYYASALHEIAHWCVAGASRRLQVDFGYWYCPDGRDAPTQRQFEQVEIKPQALEWLFCVAAGFPFNVSCDNLSGNCEPDRMAFQGQVHGKVMDYLSRGIPQRAARFIGALQSFYQTAPLTPALFRHPADLAAVSARNNQ
ncbi:elongation factor P hydroxylase [Sodalis sp. dw_96]|uniref:elongation factor P hydroxylase n=1 Tax=Sodalis sp. dw_96 TaxID=2719794 RepID=UPI001BD4A6D5|nr:elongation factor P hydroxylase [Sodalis sp. dw_96]